MMGVRAVVKLAAKHRFSWHRAKLRVPALQTRFRNAAGSSRRDAPFKKSKKHSGQR
jgi:hypothetical protein